MSAFRQPLIVLRADGRPPARDGITATRVVLRGTVPAGDYWAAPAGDSPWQAGQRLPAGAELHAPQPAWTFPDLPEEEPIPFHYEVLHVDKELVVIDKPHFLPTTSNGRLVAETVQTRLRREFGEETTPLHRLDRLTAGVVVAARTPAARSRYQPMFERRSVAKLYHARVQGHLAFPEWHKVTLPMARMPGQRQVRAGEGQPTVTWVRSDAQYPDQVWLRPETGHTHQLRVLMNHLGAPIVGDDTYPVDRGLDLYDFDQPLHLVARVLELPGGRAFRSSRVLPDKIS